MLRHSHYLACSVAARAVALSSAKCHPSIALVRSMGQRLSLTHSMGQLLPPSIHVSMRRGARHLQTPRGGHRLVNWEVWSSGEVDGPWSPEWLLSGGHDDEPVCLM